MDPCGAPILPRCTRARGYTAGSLYCFDLSFTPKLAVGSPFLTNAIVATSVRADYDSTAATIPGCPASHSTAAAVVRDTGAVAHDDVSFSLIFE
jgi:hypothetical protein